MATETDGDSIFLGPIPWWPGEYQLVTPVRRSLIEPTDPRLVRGVTLYGDWKHKDARWIKKGCGEFTYGGAANGSQANGGSGYSVFIWNPPIVPGVGVELEDEEHPEILVDEKWTVEMYFWPDIRMDIQALVAQIAAGAGDKNKEPVDRAPGVEGGSFPTRTQRLIYSSTRPPGRAQLRINPPMPSPIFGDYYGKPIRIPSCLHPEVILESIASDDAEMYDLTPDVKAERVGNKLIYPATNHQGWVPHVSNVDVTDSDDGLYKRIVTRRIPPPLQPPSYG